MSILDGNNGRELLQLLVTEGVEIRVGVIEGGAVQLTIRAPKRMMIVEELASAEWPDKGSIHG